MIRLLRKWRLACLFLLLAATTHAAPPANGPRVTLPDAGTYAYWVRSVSGVASTMPVTVSGQKQISLPGGAADGDTLFVLDKHTSNVAATPVTTKPITLAVDDFKSLTSAVSAPAAPAATPAPAAKPAEAPAEQPQGGSMARLLTLFFGLLVAGGVAWVLWRLIQSRGQPLIDAARKLGVDVPDPAAPAAEADAAPVYTPPAPRAVEKIPDEAGAVPPPPAAPARRAASVGTLDAPQLVGIQGLAAGSAFAVSPGEVLIGRDGDNGIVLAESTVSRLHARLARDGAGRITLTDEGSANGIFVNGMRVTEATLASGDQIQIGDNFFRLES